MTKSELIQYCLTFADAYEDYPFGEDDDWAAMRHKNSSKTFAFIYEREEKLCANLKCDPMRSDFLRGVFSGVVPAYHMNKKHWNTVYVNEVPIEELQGMLEHSHSLTQSTKKFKNKG